MPQGFYVRPDGAQEIVVDPSSDKEYAIAWTAWLNGDLLTTSTWSVSPSGPSLYGDSINGTEMTIEDPVTGADVVHPVSSVATVWVKTLVAGVRYRVTNHVVTAAGRTDERSFWLWVRDL